MGYTTGNARVRAWTKAAWFQGVGFEVIMWCCFSDGQAIHKGNIKGNKCQSREKEIYSDLNGFYEFYIYVNTLKVCFCLYIYIYGLRFK